jgi:hypothetical protein
MHGMELCTAGMHNQVGQWASQQFIAKLLGVLFDQGFVVFLTSDHGRPIRRLGTTRQQLLEEVDRPALKPLPVEPYEFCEWLKVDTDQAAVLPVCPMC